MTQSCLRQRMRNGARMGVILGGILLAKGCCCFDFDYESDESGCGGGYSDWEGGYHGWDGGGTGGTVGDASRPDADAQPDGSLKDSGTCVQDAGPGPTGWSPYPWSCGCVLFVPDSPDAGLLPTPIEWEPCAVSLPNSVVCEQMARESALGPFELGTGMTASLDATTGATLLQFVRSFPALGVASHHAVVAEADGAVVFSLLLQGEVPCRIEAQSLAEGRSLFRMIGGVTPTNTLGSEQGFVAGRVDDVVPSHSARWPLVTSQADRWFVSRDWIIRLGDTVTVTSWGASGVAWESSASESNTWLSALPVEGEVLLEVGLGPNRQLWTWNAKVGLRALRGETGVVSASLLGTDGVHMAWAERRMEPSPDGGKQSAMLMKGWFTTDAQELSSQAEKVRAQMGPFGGEAYRVGCGMAARTIHVSSSSRSDLVVTRLDDGVAWVLDASAEGAALLSWERVVGITCEDVYVEAATDGGTELMRIRLDSLGTGVPPNEGDTK